MATSGVIKGAKYQEEGTFQTGTMGAVPVINIKLDNTLVLIAKYDPTISELELLARVSGLAGMCPGFSADRQVEVS